VINEVPEDFPATLLWRFRLASLGTQTVLWTVLGLGFAAALEPRRLRATESVPSVSSVA
jgi:Probable cobalt transporter subunit (CbtA)